MGKEGVGILKTTDILLNGTVMFKHCLIMN